MNSSLANLGELSMGRKFGGDPPTHTLLKIHFVHTDWLSGVYNTVVRVRTYAGSVGPPRNEDFSLRACIQ